MRELWQHRTRCQVASRRSHPRPPGTCCAAPACTFADVLSRDSGCTVPSASNSGKTGCAFSPLAARCGSSCWRRPPPGHSTSTRRARGTASGAGATAVFISMFRARIEGTATSSSKMAGECGTASPATACPFADPGSSTLPARCGRETCWAWASVTSPSPNAMTRLEEPGPCAGTRAADCSPELTFKRKLRGWRHVVRRARSRSASRDLRMKGCGPW